MSETVIIGAHEFRLWQHENGYWYAIWRDGKKRRRALKTKDERVARSRLPAIAQEIDDAVLPTFAQYADRILSDEDAYLRQKSLSDQTVYAKRRCIQLLVKWFGPDRLGSTREVTIERSLRNSIYKPSYQREIMDAYTFVMERAQRDGFDVRRPVFYRPDRNSTRRDALTQNEVRALFPDTVEDIAKLYSEDGDNVRQPCGVMFGLLYRTILHAGLRPGEGRALGRHQVHLDHGVVVVSRMLDRHNQPQALKKRKYGDSDVFRLVALPSRTVELLQWWIDTTEPQDYLFTYHGEPVRQRYISERWGRVLERAKINRTGRKLDVYSLRVTYRSMTEGWLPRAALMDAMGHRSADVHDGYLRYLDRQVEAAAAHRAAADTVWSHAGKDD